MPSPKVSVVIPVYQAEVYLLDTLKALANQRYKNLEVFCVDDGSTDGSVQIAEEFAASDARFKVLCKKNNGTGSPGGAREMGLCHACGDYLVFVDADDIVPSQAIAYYVDALEANPECDLAVSESVISIAHSGVYEDVNIEQPKWRKVDSMGVSPRPIRADDFLVWGRMYRASLAKKLKFLDDNTGDDAMFNVDFMALSKKELRTSTALYGYRLTPNSSSRAGLKLRSVSQRIQLIDHIWNKYAGTGYELMSIRWAESAVFGCVHAMYAGRRTECVKEVYGYFREQMDRLKKQGVYSLAQLPWKMKVKLFLTWLKTLA